MAEINLKKVKHIHFVGIKGVGMAALALCARDLGKRVSGSDIEEVFVTDETLRKAKIAWKKGFNLKNLSPRPDLVIATGAHGGLNNSEVVAAKKAKIPVLMHAQALGLFMEGKTGISVCGVGGKTTTSAMIATLLDTAGFHPSFAVGVGSIAALGAPGRYDKKGEHFVTEADEFVTSPGIDDTPRFFHQKPKIAVVTNIEYDHPDVYPNLVATIEIFKQFFVRLGKEGLLVACWDNANTRKTANQLVSSGKIDRSQVVSYGFSPAADFRIEKVHFTQGKTIFDLTFERARIPDLVLPRPGRYNVLNATAAVAVGNFLGISFPILARGLARFSGTRRRFELIAETAGVKLYDDYAHHPAQIAAVLAAVRPWFPQGRTIAIFQPHTYSRTKALLAEFARSFSQAAVVVITDIYASAREKKDPDVSGEKLAFEVAKHHPEARYLPKGELAEFVQDTALPGDIIMTLGAGDIFHEHKSILAALKRRES